MARHREILEKLNPLPETRTLGEQLIRQAKLKTGPGSGRSLGTLDAAIPAVCMRLATERLNNGDITDSAAQSACCLKPKDYRKAYDLIIRAIEEAEKQELTYDELHEMYNTDSLDALMKPYFSQVEKELLSLDKGLDRRMAIFTGAVFFWVKKLPETLTFIQENDLPNKRFIQLLELLNSHCMPLRKKIETKFKSKDPSPTKKSTTTAPSTPRQSPRKSTTEDPEQSPLRRQSLRNNPELGTLSTLSPNKRVNQLSSNKIAQPSPFRGLPGRKAPIRELPSKDSPKKRAVPSEQNKDNGMDIDSTPITEPPAKKRKVDSPTKQTSIATSSNTRNVTVESEVLVSPTKKKAMFAPSSPVPRSTSGWQVAVVESDSSPDESEPEINSSMRRFRPVYLDFKQWNVRDPRLDRIWRKAGKQCKALAASNPPEEPDEMDID
ncbi:hypothetical protein CVT25_008879 [Psilocybe cyanescens]|uniref:Uncharacterized protein n=1 Tax=Psilocybe cyanescens TaxID=93625 RepID=A0A409VRE1_PSICY|nr:hypothetical protein CVT25_008879 [Psilocybe cyanescens]